MEIKIVLQKNGKFNILLHNTKQALFIDATMDVEWKDVGEETQKLLKRYF